MRIDKLMGKRVTSDGIAEYLVKWSNCPESENSWEVLDSADPIVVRFEKEKKPTRASPVLPDAGLPDGCPPLL